MYEEQVPLTNTSAKTVSTREKISFWLILGLIFLIPVFFVPSLSVPLPLAKNILIGLGLVLGLILFLIGILRDGKIVFPRSYLMWSVILIPVAYLVSSYYGISKNLSLFGYNLEVGTFASTVLVFGLMALAIFIVNDRGRIFRTHGALYLSFILVSIFALIKLFSGGKLLVLENFAGNLGNPIGSWTDYSIYFGLFALLGTIALEYLPIKRPMRFFLYAVYIVAIFMLAVINFTIAWKLTLIGSIILLVISLTKNLSNISENSTKNSLYDAKYVIILAVIALFFTINPNISSTGSLGNSISAMFGIQNTEVRPSWTATFDVTKPVLKSSPIVGAGPNTFASEWLINKPAVINGTAFWNVAFPFGVGFLPTQIASVGILGGILWAVFLILFLVLGYKAVWKNLPAEKNDRYLILSSFIGALFLWAASVIYVPSVVILSLALLLTGLFVSTGVATGSISSRTFGFTGSPRKNIFAVIVVILLLLGTIIFGFKSFQKTVSAIYFQKALVAANNGTKDQAWIKEQVSKAVNFSPEDLYYRALSTLAFTQAQQIVNSPNASNPEQLQAFQTAYSESITASQKAIDVNPGNYENYVALGGLYEALVPAPLAVQGAYENAKASYEKALELNPKSPEIPLMLARLELSNRNADAARKYIEESISLKNDYAAAYFLLARLELGVNNVATAIKAAESGAILSPGNAGVYFELGLLKYTNKDYRGAAEAFIAALSVVPDYANAQYFLGLSLYELGDKDAALQQFLALQKTNPDNAEVKAIIANLQAGKAPFFPAASSTAGPANKTNPPLQSAPSR